MENVCTVTQIRLGEGGWGGGYHWGGGVGEPRTGIIYMYFCHCKYVCEYVYIKLYLYIHIYIYMHIYIYIYVHAYVYKNIFICTYIQIILCTCI